MTVNNNTSITKDAVTFNDWADTAARSRRIRRPTTVYVEKKIKIPPSRDVCNSTIKAKPDDEDDNDVISKSRYCWFFI